jgi:hypothetical protein
MALAQPHRPQPADAGRSGADRPPARRPFRRPPAPRSATPRRPRAMRWSPGLSATGALSVGVPDQGLHLVAGLPESTCRYGGGGDCARAPGSVCPGTLDHGSHQPAAAGPGHRLFRLCARGAAAARAAEYPRSAAAIRRRVRRRGATAAAAIVATQARAMARPVASALGPLLGGQRRRAVRASRARAFR